MKSIYRQLLEEWGDGLIRHQLHDLGEYADGGILCPSCKHIHGRCPDAIYGLMTLADYTGETRYLESARELFKWQENLLCDDGTLYNDANSAWNGITVFAIVSLHEALVHHGHLLEKAEKAEWENRMLKMSEWVSDTIVPGYINNINYLAGSAAVQALLSRYFKLPLYEEKARALADYVMARVTENGLICGEGVPHDKVTDRGCRPVDIGYNVEETLPLMIRYAIAVDDQPLIERLAILLRLNQEFLLSDGGWDNSFGTRNNKWTYWGSRTSDGCQTGYALLADRDITFAEAARRNTELLASCTHEGLLYGGPEYKKHGELPCVHHTFAHINAIAAALDAGIEKYEERVSLPCDNPKQAIKYFPEIDTYKLSVGDWRSTITGYDFWLEKGHASGGTMTLLWHKKIGPVLLSSVVEYRMAEPLNMQLPLKKERHRSLTPRLEYYEQGVRYSTCYDTGATIEVSKEKDVLHIHVLAKFVSLEQKELSQPISCDIIYFLSDVGLSIEVKMSGAFEGARLTLPIIADSAQVKTTPDCAEPERIFFLTGGFGAREFVIYPNEKGCLQVEITYR